MISKHKNIYDFKKVLSLLEKKIREFSNKKNNISRYFLNRVDEIKDGASDYYNIIPVPCYINLILDRLENSYYINFESVIFDFNLIKDNSMEYNGNGNPVTGLAQELFNNLISLLDDVLKFYNLESDFLLLYKDNKFFNKNHINNLGEITKTYSNKKNFKNKNNEVNENNSNEIIVGINKENDLKLKNDNYTNESKSEYEYEYDTNVFNLDNNLLQDNLEIDQKFNNNNLIKTKRKRGRKRKVVQEDQLKGTLNNSNYFSKENSNKRLMNENSNNISIPINESKILDSIRTTRYKKQIKYNENNFNDKADVTSLISSKSEKLIEQKIRKRGRPRKNNIVDCKEINEVSNEFENDTKENLKFSLYNNLGRKRNRQIIKFELNQNEDY